MIDLAAPSHACLHWGLRVGGWEECLTVWRWPEIAVNLGLDIVGRVRAMDLVRQARCLDMISAISSRSPPDLCERPIEKPD